MDATLLLVQLKKKPDYGDRWLACVTFAYPALKEAPVLCQNSAEYHGWFLLTAYATSLMIIIRER